MSGEVIELAIESDHLGSAELVPPQDSSRRGEDVVHRQGIDAVLDPGLTRLWIHAAEALLTDGLALFLRSFLHGLYSLMGNFADMSDGNSALVLIYTVVVPYWQTHCIVDMDLE